LVVKSQQLLSRGPGDDVLCDFTGKREAFDFTGKREAFDCREALALSMKHPDIMEHIGHMTDDERGSRAVTALDPRR
jgi:hypothetical protein